MIATDLYNIYYIDQWLLPIYQWMTVLLVRKVTVEARVTGGEREGRLKVEMGLGRGDWGHWDTGSIGTPPPIENP